MRYLLIALLSALLSPMALAAFTIDDDGAALTIKENDKPVLVYHYSLVKPPGRIKERYRRAGYIHPLYGLDGEVMTQDFPIDHFHHRGVFWAWPNSTVEEKDLNVWLLDGVRQVHEKFLMQEVTDDAVQIRVQNAWLYDDAPEAPQMRESIIFTIHPEQDGKRAIDFQLKFENVSGKTITVRGATTDNKGYGGFCFRPDARRKPLTFTAANGVEKEDVLELESPWVDISYKKSRKSKEQSGVAIFQHDSVPGYPHPGWILRHYGFLGASYPHTTPLEMKPGDSFKLQYQLLVHRGSAQEAKIAEAFAAYAGQAK